MAVDVTESNLETMCKDGEMASTWAMTLFTLFNNGVLVATLGDRTVHHPRRTMGVATQANGEGERHHWESGRT